MFCERTEIFCSIPKTLKVRPCSNKELRQILYEYKKGASRCIYPNEAVEGLYTINANDPRPERAVALGHTTNYQLKS